MSKRLLVMVLALGLLLAAGALIYVNKTSNTLAAAEDCDEKPKPKAEAKPKAKPKASAAKKKAPAKKKTEEKDS